MYIYTHVRIYIYMYQCEPVNLPCYALPNSGKKISQQISSFRASWSRCHPSLSWLWTGPAHHDSWNLSFLPIPAFQTSREKYLFGIGGYWITKCWIDHNVLTWKYFCSMREALGLRTCTILQNMKHPKMSSHTLVQNTPLWFHGQENQIGPWLYSRLILIKAVSLHGENPEHVCGWELISLFCGSIKPWHRYKYLFSHTIHQLQYLHCLHYLDT